MRKLLILTVILATFGVHTNCQECPPDDDMETLTFLPGPRCSPEFYLCLFGDPILLECPTGLYFDRNKNECTDFFDCNSTSNGDGPPCPLEDDPENSTLLPGPTCEEFYLCSNGEAILRHCPAGLHFNPDKHVCDWTHDANCISSDEV